MRLYAAEIVTCVQGVSGAISVVVCVVLGN